MLDFTKVRLGCVNRPLPPSAPDLSTHRLAAMRAPQTLAPRLVLPFKPILGHNDSVGDCTTVGLSNAIIAQAVLSGFTVPIPDSSPVKLYGDIGGYPAVDQGLVPADMLDYQVKNGYDTGGQTPFVGDWAAIDPADRNLLGLATDRVAVSLLGVNLALADQNQDKAVWDLNTPASAGDPTPGTWGGHFVCIWAYNGMGDDDLVYIVTWGILKRATWRWVRSRTLDAYAIFHRQLVGPSGRNYAGIDADRLAADCRSFAG